MSEQIEWVLVKNPLDELHIAHKKKHIELECLESILKVCIENYKNNLIDSKSELEECLEKINMQKIKISQIQKQINIEKQNNENYSCNVLSIFGIWF